MSDADLFAYFAERDADEEWAREMMARYPSWRTVDSVLLSRDWGGDGGRNALPDHLDDWDRHESPLDADDLHGLVVNAWSSAEFPERHLPRRRWTELFRRAGYAVPEEPLILYRGARSRRRFGMAWTTALTTARWFAERDVRSLGARSAYVYRAWAPPVAVLCDVDQVEGDGGRSEAEVVVDPTKLLNIERIERFTAQEMHSPAPRTSRPAVGEA